MLVTKQEIYERLSDYEEEQLLRILTEKRAQYRPEALAAAEEILMRRGVTPPLSPAPTFSPVVAAGAVAQPKRPYHLIDFFVDVLLFSLLYVVTRELDVGSVLPESFLADGIVRLLLISFLTVVVIYLRHVWRTKQW